MYNRHIGLGICLVAIGTTNGWSIWLGMPPCYSVFSAVHSHSLHSDLFTTFHWPSQLHYPKLPLIWDADCYNPLTSVTPLPLSLAKTSLIGYRLEIFPGHTVSLILCRLHRFKFMWLWVTFAGRPLPRYICCFPHYLLYELVSMPRAVWSNIIVWWVHILLIYILGYHNSLIIFHWKRVLL